VSAQSLQPWQVQSAIATIAVLVTIGLTAAGWAMAIRTAKLLQDRERSRRHKSVARALLAETRRIHQELGDPPEKSFGFSIYGSVPMVPEISRWVDAVMVDAASLDPDIVALFMTLDRELHNLRGDQHMVSQAYKNRDEAEVGVKKLKDSMDRDDPQDAEALSDRLGSYLTTLFEMERRERRASETVETLEHLRNRMDKSARETLAKLQEKLQTVAESADNEPRIRRGNTKRVTYLLRARQAVARAWATLPHRAVRSPGARRS
jgi:hypothetical protein